VFHDYFLILVVRLCGAGMAAFARRQVRADGAQELGEADVGCWIFGFRDVLGADVAGLVQECRMYSFSHFSYLLQYLE